MSGRNADGGTRPQPSRDGEQDDGGPEPEPFAPAHYILDGPRVIRFANARSPHNNVTCPRLQRFGPAHHAPWSAGSPGRFTRPRSWRVAGAVAAGPPAAGVV